MFHVEHSGVVTRRRVRWRVVHTTGECTRLLQETVLLSGTYCDWGRRPWEFPPRRESGRGGNCSTWNNLTRVGSEPKYQCPPYRPASHVRSIRECPADANRRANVPRGTFARRHHFMMWPLFVGLAQAGWADRPQTFACRLSHVPRGTLPRCYDSVCTFSRSMSWSNCSAFLSVSVSL